MLQQASYRGPERRRFRRIDLVYAVRLETMEKSPGSSRTLVEGMTENLSFGGALVGVVDATVLPGATPVTVRFVADEAAPATITGVIWRHGQGDDDRVAIEFDVPLLAYEGAVEVADRVQWLREMGGDDFARQNVARFLDAIPEGIHLAQERCAAADLQAVAQITRELKSHAGNIGAANLYEIARRAEQAAREGDLASARRFVDALPSYFKAVRKELLPLA